MMPEWLQMAIAIITPVSAAAGAYAAVKVKLEWLQSNVEKAHKRLDKHDDELREIWKEGAV